MLANSLGGSKHLVLVDEPATRVAAPDGQHPRGVVEFRLADRYRSLIKS